MGVEIVHRSARRTPRASVASDQDIERPPTLPDGGGGWAGLLMLVPMLGAGASMTVMMLFRGSSLAAVGALMMILTVLASVVMVFSQRGKATRSRRQQREAYLSYVERLRAELRRSEQTYLDGARQSQPHPMALASLVRGRHRLWERRRSDGDYLLARLGTGSAPVHDFSRQGEDNPIRQADDFMQGEMEQIERRFGRCRDAPIAISLQSAGAISVVGDRQFCHHVARVLISQACALVSPEDLHLAAVLPPQRRRASDWVTWLPHLADQDRPGVRAPRLRLAPNVAQLTVELAEDLSRRVDAAGQDRYRSRGGARHTMPTLLVLADQHGKPAQPVGPSGLEVSAEGLGISTIHLLASQDDEPSEVSLRIAQHGSTSTEAAQGPAGSLTATSVNATSMKSQSVNAIVQRYEARDVAPTDELVQLDDFAVCEADALARMLAGLRLSPDSLEHQDHNGVLGVATMLGLDDPRDIDLDRAWAGRSRRDFLRVPIGLDDAGQPVMLDLKESAQSGMGPHGLCVGATGSGKSELLRTLVLGLLTTHSPEDVAMVLVDYKGGATFAPFARAPHVHGVVTNLNDDAVLIERIYASLSGEVRRRQELLREAGDLADITAYRRLRQERAGSGSQMSPMPHLLVIIDEFGELLSARPDFIELFLSIGRIGRSIGVHLLLSSQRIEAGKLRGLETYLSYRVGLRTLSETESRTVLNTPDAFTLPAMPGYGYLCVDTTVYTRFRAGYVSGPIPAPPSEQPPERVQVYAIPAYPDGHGEAVRQSAPHDHGPDTDPGSTLLSCVLDALATRPRVGAAIWSQPLPNTLRLDQIRPEGARLTRAGLRIPRSSPLRVPLGLMDDPARQWQGPWELDLGVAGNVLIVAGPRSGSTTLLRTLVASISITHNAGEFVVYGVDALGSNLTALQALPCVAGVAGRLDSERLKRVIEEVHALLQEREAVFARLGASSLSSAREMLGKAGSTTTAGVADNVASVVPMLADVVLLIDGFGPLVEEHPGCVEAVSDLIRRGPAYGIRVISTVARWNEVRLNQQTFFDTTIELRLADVAESRLGRALAQTLTKAPSGRCLLASGLFAQVALPQIENPANEQGAAAGFAALVHDIEAAASHRVQGMRVLPLSVQIADLPARGAHAAGSKRTAVPIGIEGSAFETLDIDLDGVDRHLLLIGDPRTGRTSVVRHVISTLVARYSPAELVIAQIDPKRAMQGEVPEEYLGGYASATPLAARLVEAVLPELERRAAGLADAAAVCTPAEPRIVVVVDDYDVMTASGSSPLQALVPYVAMAREINLNVIVARRTNGAARGIFEPAYAALRECGATGLLFSGDRGEGQLFGSVRPGKLPVGRALLIRAGDETHTVQTVHAPAPHSGVQAAATT